MHFYPTCRS